jgi:RNA-binding protein YhbY
MKLHAWERIKTATTPQEMREAIIDEIELRAYQARMVATIGRTTKQFRAGQESVARNFHLLATHLREIVA